MKNIVCQVNFLSQKQSVFCFYMNKIRKVLTLHKLSNNTLPNPMTIQKQNQESKEHNRIPKKKKKHHSLQMRVSSIHQLEMVNAATKPTKRDTDIVP